MAPGNLPNSPPKGGRLVGTLFFSVFFLMGLGFEVVIVRQTASNLATYSWAQTEAVVISSGVVPPRDAENDPMVDVRYAYTADGKAHEGNGIKIGVAAFETSHAYRLAQRFAVGAKVPCWFNPNSPDAAVLIRESPASGFLVLFPLIFVAVGSIGIWSVWRTKTAVVTTEPISGRAKNAKSGRAAVILISLLFLLLGLGIGYPLFFQPLSQILRAQNWSQVPAEVVASRVRIHPGDKGRTYSIDVVYRYLYQERTYTSNRYHFSTGSSSGYQGKADVVQRLPPGALVFCFVDPADPAESVLERGITSMFWFGLIPLAFALAGAAGLVFAFRRKPADAVTPVLNPFTSTWRSAVGSAIPNQDQSGGPQQLTPAVSPKAKLFGLLIFALFWNGIVSVFVVNLFKNGWGGVTWFLALFLTPFVAIGLGVIGGVFYYAMALLNPRPRLTISRRVLLPGEAASVRWELAGRADRLRRLQIALEGREEATYRRGTDTRTDKEIFACIQLADTNDPFTMQSGSAQILLPPDALHSFNATNNKIVWVLKVSGEIPRWPDINDEYPVTVAPAPFSR